VAELPVPVAVVEPVQSLDGGGVGNIGYHRGDRPPQPLRAPLDALLNAFDPMHIALREQFDDRPLCMHEIASAVSGSRRNPWAFVGSRRSSIA